MALDILHDNWGPYTHTEVENALKAYLTVLENRINQAIQSGGVGLADLSAEVQALLNKANTALQPENIAAWAKAQNKPGYTVSEITGVEGFQNLLAKLQDMDQKIQAAAQSGGVDPDDEMSSTSEKPVQNKVIKAYVDGLIQGLQNVLNTITQDGATQGVIDTFNEVKAFLEGISSSDTLAAKLALLVPKTRTINNKPLSSNVVIGINDIEGLAAAIAAAGNGAVSVSVPNPADGTFTIHVGETAYAINLNHEHEAMARLRLYTQATMPQQKALDTIYAQVDNVSTPSEIQKLFIAGLEFEKGWVPDTGEPAIKSPSDGTTIHLGVNDGSGVSKTITVRGWNLTGDLTVAVGGTNMSLSYGNSTGQSSITIAKADALLGAQVTIVFSGSSSLAEGSLVISHGGDVLSAVTLQVGDIVVPSGYTQLDYIDNIGTGILTTIPVKVSSSPFVGSKWEVDTELVSSPSAVQMIVASDNNTAHWFGALTDGKLGIGNTSDGWTFDVSGRNTFDVEFVSKGVKVTCNGTSKTRTSPSNIEHGSGLGVALLGNMNTSNPSAIYKGKVYSVKCTSGGAFNGVPAKRNSDNKVGLYDTANNVFYPLTT